MINLLPTRAHARVLLRVRRPIRATWIAALGFCLVAPFFATAGPGDNSAVGIVAKEIARRQQLVDDAKLAIIEGDTLVDQFKFDQAIEKYFAAFSSTDDSPLAGPVHELARNRFASFSVIYARELAEGARYTEAEQVIDRVLDPAVAPDHPAANTFKIHLADPERFNPALTPEHLEKVDQVNDLFREAEGHMRIGNFDMANLTYAAILREDPTNEAARRGMAAADLEIRNYHDAARDHFRSKALSQIDKQWELSVPISVEAREFALSLPGASNSDGIADRLRNIMIDEIEFTDEPLSAVAEYLTLISKQRDPTGTGVNFVLELGPADAGLRDIPVNLILRGVPLGELVRFVTEATGTKFSIDQFAVVIRSVNSSSDALITKSFFVPPDFLSSAPAGDDPGDAFNDPFGGGGGNKTGLLTVRLDARTYLERSGVPFPEGASASHVAGTNTLVVRNTQSNLDLVESIVDALRKDIKAMVQINITQYELDVTNSEELTFDHLLGQFNLPGSSSVFGAGAGAFGNPDEFAFTPPGSDVPVGDRLVTEGVRSGDNAIGSAPIDGVLNNGVSQAAVGKADAMFGISTPFGDPQYQLAIRAINQYTVKSITNRPTVVTNPGQRAVIDVNRDFPFPTEYDPPEIPQTFGGGGGGGGGIIFNPVTGTFSFVPGTGNQNNAFPITPAHPTAFDVRSIGTRMEVEPIIDPNGFLVNLNLSVEFSQFEGFINYGTPITSTDGVVLTDNRILQPLFKVSRIAQPVSVYDGANFVIGGLMNEDAEFTEDKVPFLGDVPIVGRLFRGNVEERRRKAILFFVKVSIIDSAGQGLNR